MILFHHHEGSPALDCLSSATCHPCYPGRSSRPIPFSLSECVGLPLLSTESASSFRFSRLHLGSLALRPAVLPSGNLRPLITQTPLPCATGVHGQFPGRDFNPLDNSVVTANGQPPINFTPTGDSIFQDAHFNVSFLHDRVQS